MSRCQYTVANRRFKEKKIVEYALESDDGA